MTFADLSALPPVATQRGGDPDLLKAEMVEIIEAAVIGAPRSLQRQIGPSEIGHPCDRRIGYRLAGTEPVNVSAGWRPTVGTAVHTWLADTFAAANKRYRLESGQDVTRWLVEMRVDVGEIGESTIVGSCDIYDRVTATLIDWKIVASTSLREAKISGPSPQYRTQAHLYARGYTRRGVPVDTVGVFWLPSAGELHEGHFWTEPYDEQIAIDALARASNIDALTRAFGEKVFLVLDTSRANPRICRYCPYNLAASTELSVACPGPDKKAATAAA